MKDMLSKKYNLYKERINNEIKGFLDGLIFSEKNSILQDNYKIIQAFILRDGKRIRPLITLGIYNAIKGRIDEQIILSVISSEILHSGTLVHDDIIDEDDIRRGLPSIHKIAEKLHSLGHDKEIVKLFRNSAIRYGVSIAILHGNLLYSLGIECLLKSNILPEVKDTLIKKYNETYRDVNEGQILDIELTKSGFNEEKYIEMITKKTSALFIYSVELGAQLGDGTNEQLGILRECITNYSLAFQIMDDITDKENIGITQESSKKYFATARGLLMKKIKLPTQDANK
ncbi:MAG: polyprenyl synthetase family protein, partial [Nanoarchaeota archaeon]